MCMARNTPFRLMQVRLITCLGSARIQVDAMYRIMRHIGILARMTQRTTQKVTFFLGSSGETSLIRRICNFLHLPKTRMRIIAKSFNFLSSWSYIRPSTHRPPPSTYLPLIPVSPIGEMFPFLEKPRGRFPVPSIPRCCRGQGIAIGKAPATKPIIQ